MLNKVMLIGRLGADPEVRYMPSGDAITTIRLATSRRWKDRNTNERKEESEWHRVVFFSGLAKIAGEYLKKGSQCYVEGRIRTQKWQGQDGSDRYTTEIVAENMHMLDSKSGVNGQHTEQNPENNAQHAASSGGYDDFEDIPFTHLNNYIKNHLI